MEVLVLLSDPLTDLTIRILHEKHKVKQVAARHLLILRIDKMQLEELRSAIR